MEAEEKALDARYKNAAKELDEENKKARGELDGVRKALAREKGGLASKGRKNIAETEAAARKVSRSCVSVCVCLCMERPLVVCFCLHSTI